MKKLIALFALLPMISFASICVEQTSDAGDVTWLHCPNKTTVLLEGDRAEREMLWQVPEGRTPKKGWPAVILSQGSWFPIQFSRPSNIPLGGFYEAKLIQKLLDNGYAVFAPRAPIDVAWMTNLPHGGDYTKTDDYAVLSELIRLLQKDKLAKINSDRIYATGISSGGYNTSRLAITFPGVFKAIAIQSGSYASCIGPVCKVPDTLESNHPPTLFVHGKRDFVVPLSTARKYHEKLQDLGVKSLLVIDPTLGHGWSRLSPLAITRWFDLFY
ncbi:MAG: prolyl oligopeptidase family serine peptidase [bacterium]